MECGLQGQAKTESSLPLSCGVPTTTQPCVSVTPSVKSVKWAWLQCPHHRITETTKCQ